MGEHSKQWDNVLDQYEFSYNNSPNMSTRKSPFQISCGMHASGICDLRYLGKLENRSDDGDDFVIQICDLHEEVKPKLQVNNYNYKQRVDLRRRKTMR